MVIRRRLGGAICLVPYIFCLLIGSIFENQFIIDISLLLMIVCIPFSGKFYDLFLLSYNSTSSFYAGKIALQNGFAPKGQNDEIWNPQNYTISEIYQLFPDNRTRVPVQGTAGFLFYTNMYGKKANQMEFYDYRQEGDFLIDYEFYFHPFDNNGDKINRKELDIKEISDKMIFVPLNKL